MLRWWRFRTRLTTKTTESNGMDLEDWLDELGDGHDDRLDDWDE